MFLNINKYLVKVNALLFWVVVCFSHVGSVMQGPELYKGENIRHVSDVDSWQFVYIDRREKMPTTDRLLGKVLDIHVCVCGQFLQHRLHLRLKGTVGQGRRTRVI